MDTTMKNAKNTTTTIEDKFDELISDFFKAKKNDKELNIFLDQVIANLSLWKTRYELVMQKILKK